jgi:2-polyprenyl-6-hydroxyphenyl methylase/3-demethylubiquinone-9 3-methyltransferase
LGESNYEAKFSCRLTSKKSNIKVPPGTHDHSKYVTPIELAEYLGRAGADIIDMAGLSYDLSMNKWDLQSEDDGFGSLDMNYILVAKKNST